MKWKRNCSDCGEEIPYSTKRAKISAEKRNTKCKSCASLGRIFSDEIRKKISESLKGRIITDEHKKKLRESLKGIKREPFTDEHRKNQRLSAIKRIEKNKFNGNQLIPGYNLKAIPIIREKAKKLKITDLQHAENGGEFQVCGYFVDGYSKEKNVVIEYYEPFHKNQVERDKQRKQEIIKELGCKFIEIWE